MVDQVNNNPEALHEYRGKLVQASENLQRQHQKTNSAISQVNEEGWDDPKFREFQGNFEEDKRKIEDLYKIIDEYDGLLAKLEDNLRSYGGIPAHRHS